MTEENENTIEKLKIFFEKEGLKLPAFGKQFEGELKEVSDYIYSTRNDDVSDIYNLNKYVEEIQDKAVEDYLIVGHSGHGANSFGMHVYCVEGQFAYFIQKQWGGAFADEERLRKNFNGAIGAIESIKERLKDSKTDKVLVLVESDFVGNKWAWMTKGKRIEEEAWNVAEPTFLYALSSIDE